MKQLPPSADLDADKQAHLELISRLEQLADRDGADFERLLSHRGDQRSIWDGHEVLVHAQGRWRFGVVTGWDEQSRKVVVSYMTAAALDKAQLTWWQASQRVLSEDYPADQAAAAAREAGRDRRANADEQREATKAAYRAAELTQHVARHCARRRWAAVTPVLTVLRERHELFRPAQ